MSIHAWFKERPPPVEVLETVCEVSGGESDGTENHGEVSESDIEQSVESGAEIETEATGHSHGAKKRKASLNPRKGKKRCMVKYSAKLKKDYPWTSRSLKPSLTAKQVGKFDSENFALCNICQIDICIGWDGKNALDHHVKSEIKNIINDLF